MKAGVEFLIPLVGIAAACAALGVCRASYYRSKAAPKPQLARPPSHRALTDEQRAEVLEVLDSDAYADKAPAQVYASLLDAGKRLCSIRTMYRVLTAAGQVRERRDQRRHPSYVTPRLVAYGPNQVWTWDITKVPGPVRGAFFYLYVIVDIFSRNVVGWTVATTESAAIGQELIEHAVRWHGIQPGQLTIHADRGSPMTAHSTAMLLADLGIGKSHSRPRVSNDNPFSEAAFKTFLYRPNMPDRFGSIADARCHFADLFVWYNEHHYHSGIALLTPADVHRGVASEIIAARQAVLDRAYAANPERFVRGAPKHPVLPRSVWINKPSPDFVVIASQEAQP